MGVMALPLFPVYLLSPLSLQGAWRRDNLVSNSFAKKPSETRRRTLFKTIAVNISDRSNLWQIKSNLIISLPFGIKDQQTIPTSLEHTLCHGSVYITLYHMTFPSSKLMWISSVVLHYFEILTDLAAKVKFFILISFLCQSILIQFI